MKKKVLISGGTGMIGQRLSGLLIENGYDVATLSRHPMVRTDLRSFLWDPDNNVIDPDALIDVSYIIHLAGSNIGEGRWTKERRKQIYNSRIISGEMLYNTCVKYGVKPNAFISASGVNYYGTVTMPRIFTESDPPGNDFLGSVCMKWEQIALKFASSGTRSIVVRTGVALSMNGGVLPRLAKLASKGLAAALGSGCQFVPWIHLDDLCRIYLKSITDNSMQGPCNAVAPGHITNRDLMKTLSEVYNKPFVLPSVPAVFLKLAYGQMASLVLEGSRVSSDQIRNSGYTFKFPELKGALIDLCTKH